VDWGAPNSKINEFWISNLIFLKNKNKSGKICKKKLDEILR
jgi:hypothetical protein